MAGEHREVGFSSKSRCSLKQMNSRRGGEGPAEVLPGWGVSMGTFLPRSGDRGGGLVSEMFPY